MNAGVIALFPPCKYEKFLTIKKIFLKKIEGSATRVRWVKELSGGMSGKILFVIPANALDGRVEVAKLQLGEFRFQGLHKGPHTHSS